MLSQRIGAITLQILGQARVGGLFLTGGDIATAVANALGAEDIGFRVRLRPAFLAGHLSTANWMICR
jgi:uncharacterized protein YgbK (DUF1537 family)